jgi:hypothetical protein
MEIQKLKNLIKDAVREVLKEELANLGKQKIQESLGASEAWPTANFTSNNVNPAATAALRQSLMDQMGMAAPPPVAAPTTFAEKQNVYQNILAQTAAELRQNPADISNFRNTY